MAWHIKPDGSLGKCTAKPGNCKYGENAPHFKTLDEGLEYIDEMYSDKAINDTVYYPTKLFKSFENERWDSLDRLSNSDLEELTKMINEKHSMLSQKIYAPLQINYNISDNMRNSISNALDDYGSVRDSIDTPRIKRAMLNYYPEKTLDDTLIYLEISSSAKKILKDEYIDDFVNKSSARDIQQVRDIKYESLDNAVSTDKDRNYLMLFREQQLRKLLEEKEYYGSSFTRENYDESKVLKNKKGEVKNLWILHNNIVEKVYEIKQNNFITERLGEIPINSNNYNLFYDDSKGG